MRAPAGCQLIGRWRIVEADLRDRGHLGLGGLAILKAKRAPFFNSLLGRDSAQRCLVRGGWQAQSGGSRAYLELPHRLAASLNLSNGSR